MKVNKRLIFLTIFLTLLLAACGGGENQGAENENGDTAITQVVQTAMAALTETAAAEPATPTHTATVPVTTNTPLPTMQPSPTIGISTPTATLAIQQPPGNGNTGCDSAGFVSDVTIPDGTLLAPEKEFTKTWEIKNTGSCTWNAAYQIVFYGGELMGAQAVQPFTGSEVAPGETIQVSIEMTAPATDGEYTSWWILRNANGQNFFIDGGSIYVQIEVGIPATPSPTATGGAATATMTATPLPTVSISATPATGDTSTEITFTASVVDTGGNAIPIDSIKWTYDGQTSTNQVLKYTFPNPGSYTITAEVTYLGSMTGTASITITIT
jgi:hypothetical protein